MSVARNYSVYNRNDQSLVVRNQPFPRPGLTRTMRRDPETLCENECPVELLGKLFLEESVTQAALGPMQMLGSPSYGAPDFEAGTITVHYPATLIPLARQKEALLEHARTKASELIDAGFIYEIPGSGSLYTYAIDDRTQSHMIAIQADLNNGGSGPADGVWPDVTDTDRAFTDAQWEAFARAARTYKEGILRNLRLLLRDISAADDQGAIDQIDIEDGTGNNSPTSGVNASGWPTNGS